ncbi:MAG: DEAD/DEAH box helicase [Clostridia bacterium]|nr:DEAD/DEAH box helicase [Clostridia bacterium]
MKWEQIYSSKIIESGRALYDEGKISDNVQITQNSLICTVEGTEHYKVRVTVDEPFRVRISCSCAIAADGFRCKHMVAAMMKLDELFVNWHEGVSKMKRKVPIEVVPVVTIDESQYQLGDGSGNTVMKDSYLVPYIEFNLSRIFSKKYLVTESMLERGRNLVKIRAAKVTYHSMTKLENDEKQFRLNVSVVDGYEQAEVTIICGVDGINFMRCSADKCRGYPNYDPVDGNVLCEHQVAAMLLLRSSLEKNAEPDLTDKTGTRMIESFSKLTAAEQTESLYGGQLIRMTPLLYTANNRLAVEFRCGTDRDYKINNFLKLVDAYDSQGKFQLFKSNYINFRMDRMDRTTERIIRLIRKVVKSRDKTSGGRDNVYSSINDSGIELAGVTLDEFFDIYVGKKLTTFKDKEIRLEDGTPHIHMNVYPLQDDNGRFKGVSLTGKLPMKRDGVDYVYFEQGSKWLRAPVSWFSSIAPLYEIVDSNMNVSFEIGRQRMGEFYRKVLPAMSAAMEIDDYAYEIAKDFIPPEGKNIFYLDCDEHNLFCGAKVRYGEYQAELVNRNERAGFFRDMYSEQPAYDAVTKWFPDYHEADKISVMERKDDATYSFLRNGVNELQMLGEVQASEEFRKLRIRRGFSPQVGVRVESGLLTLSVQSDEFTQEELFEILRSYQKKKNFHVLRNGEFLDLSETVNLMFEFLNATDVSLKEFVDGKMHLPAYRMLYLDEMMKTHDDIISARDESFAALLDQFDAAHAADYEPPASLVSTLREYQVTGFKWMERLLCSGFSGILADDMGLGKTIQVISVILSDKENGRSSGMTSLITCPASLVYNWIREFKRFAPSLSVVPVEGSVQQRQQVIQNDANADVLITSYDLMKRDVDKYEGCTFWLHVLDEAQYIKNQGSSAAKAAKIIEAKHRLALTGTPIENRLSELWSIFDFLMPGFLYAYSKFRNEIELPAVKYQDDDAMDRLRRMVSPFIMRRLKKDVLRDLPEKTEETRFITLSGEQQKLYSAQVEHIRVMLHETDTESPEKQRFRIMAELMRLRQICCDPALVYENYSGTSSKREELIRMIQEAIDGGHKILVFSQFTSMMALIESDLNAEGIRFYHLSGSTPKEERLSLADAFNSDDTPVFMISLKAGGTGLNLTGADIVIHFEPWWNVAAMNQATDRAHRIGQVRPVSVFNLIAQNTIEERVQELQESKRELAEGILSGETGVFNRLSREELLELLSDDGSIPQSSL